MGSTKVCTNPSTTRATTWNDHTNPSKGASAGRSPWSAAPAGDGTEGAGGHLTPRCISDVTTATKFHYARRSSI